MRGLNIYDKLHGIFSDEVSTDGGRLLPEDSTTYHIKYLSVTINLTDTCLKALAYNFS